MATQVSQTSQVLATANPAVPATQGQQQIPQVVVSYFWAYVVVGIVVVIGMGALVYHKRSGFLVGQPRSDQQHDWSMSNEIKKLEERQRVLLAKIGK